MLSPDQTLRILILEDLASDAELIQLQLEELDVKIEYTVTDKEKEFHNLLYNFRPDLVISDFTLPSYNGMKALRFLKEKALQIPFIFVTGTLGEENAVKAIKAGASDFLIKENIDQLPVAVLKALREQKEIHKKKGFERQLIAINALNSALLQHSNLNKALREAFPIIGQTLQVDRVYYFENHSEDHSGRELTSQRIEWVSRSTKAQIDNEEMQNLPHASLPQLMEQLKKGKHFQAIAPQLSESTFKEILLGQDICSILVLPIFVRNKFHGFIGFDDCRYEREWSEDEHEFLASLTSSLSSAIEKLSILEDLAQSDHQLRRAQKIAGLGYWRWRLDNELSVWSDECYAIYGYTPDNFTPTFENVRNTIHPDDRHLIEDVTPETLTGGIEQEVEHRIITATGKVRWVNLRINLVQDDNGKPSIMEGTVQDITERKANEEELRVSKERFELAMKATTELIWDWDHEKDEIFRSYGFESIFQYNIREKASKDNSWISKVHPDDVDELWDYVHLCLSNPQITQWEKEYRIIKPDGEKVFVVDRGFIIRNDSGRPLRSVGAVLDVTISREQLQRIKKQNEALREIAWVQSHVVRAPVARILGLINIFREPNHGGQSSDDLIKLLAASAKELDDIIRDITRKTSG